MITWGFVSALTACVVGTWSYFGARILLGVAEAGFFPGIIYYMSAWFPATVRARVVAWFMLAIPVATILGNLASGLILDSMEGAAGLTGWQWLFIIEGIPSVLLGISVLFLLPDGPRDAAWLTAEEREWLEADRAQEDGRRLEAGGSEKLSALADARLWILIGLYITVAIGTNATGAYLPKLVKDSFQTQLVGPGGDTTGLYWKVGLLSALPQVAAVIAMLTASRVSDASGRRTPVAFCMAFSDGASSSAARKSSVMVPVIFRVMSFRLHPLSASRKRFLSSSSCVHDAHRIYSLWDG
jgi:ACS family tartrate transporter-like MFS transporter